MDPDPFDELRQRLRGAGRDDQTEEDRQVDVRHLLLGAAGAVALALAVVVLTATRSPEAPAAEGAPREIEVVDDDEHLAPATTSPPVARVWPAEPVEVVGTEVRSGGLRWQVGQPGDVVAVGDWDCNGTATPAVIRPTTNRMYVFAAWASAEADATATPGPTVPAGVTSLAAVGCGRADVRTTDGATYAVATTTAGP